MISRTLLPLALLIANGLAQTPQAPDVVIRSSAREVLLDVVVRDAHGKLVTNLKPEEIAVYEDGVRQNVRAFRLVAGSEVRLEDEKQAAEAQAAAATTPAARPPVNPLRTVNVVCLVLNDITATENNIRGTDLIAPTRTFAFQAARKFIDNELRPNTFIGIFALDGSGLRPVYPFSNDRERLLKATQLAAANQLPAITVGSAAVLKGLSNSMGVNVMGDTGSGDDPLGSRADMRSVAIVGLREIDALKGLVRQLGSLPFQKTVLLLSNGLTRPPDQLETWDSLIHAATDGGVTFYAMDVHALDPFYDPTALASATLSYAASLSRQQGPTSQERPMPPPGQIGNLGPPTLTTRTMEQAHQDDYVRFGVSSANPQEALRELAERTGGFLIANTNNVDQLLSHVMEEVDTHYEIAYPPKAERDDGRFRKIEVKLARAGLRVETRDGYFAVPDTGHALTPEEMAGLRALDTQPHPHAFDFLSRAYRFRDSGGNAQYAIAFEMPISNLTPTAEKSAHRRPDASLELVVRHLRGNVFTHPIDDHTVGVLYQGQQRCVEAVRVRTLLGCRREVGNRHLESNSVLRVAAGIAESIGAREEIERVRVGLGIERPQAGHFLGRECVAGIGHREIPVARFHAQSGARQFHLDLAEMPVVALRFRRVGDFVVRVHFLHHVRQKAIHVFGVGDQESAGAFGEFAQGFLGVGARYGEFDIVVLMRQFHRSAGECRGARSSDLARLRALQAGRPLLRAQRSGVTQHRGGGRHRIVIYIHPVGVHRVKSDATVDSGTDHGIPVFQLIGRPRESIAEKQHSLMKRRCGELPDQAFQCIQLTKARYRRYPHVGTRP